MEFISILDDKRSPLLDRSRPDFFVDLNLDQVVRQIQNLSVVPVEKYYYCLPVDKACEAYRRQIYSDVKKTDVNKLLAKFVDRMEERKQIRDKKNAVEIARQKSAWHVLEVALYCDACSELCEGLQRVDIESKGLQALRELLSEYILTEEFVIMQKKALELRETLRNFRVKLVYENDHVFVTEEKVAGTYEDFLHTTLGDYNVQMKSPFSHPLHLSILEQEIIQRFAKQHVSYFKDIRAFGEKYQSYENEVLLQFGDEVSYYLSYCTFQKRMELKGFGFVTPTVDESKDMSAKGLYDLALACASLNTGKAVVSNDMSYGSGEQFLVVTGPNQGGKTTFARSLGQLVYLSKMGLDVPATAANVYSFASILTHFSVEESVETGRGKLMEELVRLKPMMYKEYKNAFIVINELFTTAANYDACIMGKKVLEHFIGQESMGIYVTHLKELATAHESIVSMRAMVDEQRVQNFKICRHEADDSVCALNQVNKHRLTYEQLKERLR